jgi:arabinoxylan arabinofuranohydrolase
MKSDGAVDNSAGEYRSICVNKATVNESTATVNPVSLTIAGVKQIKNMDPYVLQEAETMARSGGIEYEDITNIKKNTRISTLGNDASENMQVKMVASSWFNVRKVDFGTGAAKVTVRAKGTGKLDIRTSLSPRGTIATLEFSSEDMEEKTIDVDATKFKGVKNNIYFVVSE